tara:strand:- start:323 stop:565 length:243 start_codon:yes stop_codon:yes gene_type:complete
MRKFLAEWGYGRPTGYFAEVELFDEDLKRLEQGIGDKKIAGGRFESPIYSIELQNGMKLYAEKTVAYIQAKERMKNGNSH